MGLVNEKSSFFECFVYVGACGVRIHSSNNCVLLDKAGSVSAILVNGSKRNTQVAVRKALRVKGATHVGYTKGKPGTTNVRMFVWSCPNPNLKTSDPQVAEWQRDYLGHD